MRMWTSLSVSRCMFLLTLAVLMLFSESQADSVVGLPCCRNVSTRKVVRIRWCYEQKPREGCNRHAFLIATNRHKDKPWCINPNSKWLKDKIEKGELNCPQDLTLLNEAMQVPYKMIKS